LLAMLGGFAAILVAYWGGTLVRKLLLGDLTLDVSPVDARVVTFTVLIALVVGLMTGLFPALQSSKPNLSDELKAGNREGGGQRSRARNILLVGQAALCLVLLAGAGLFVRSLARLAAMPLGVDIDKVLFASMNLQSVGRPRTDVDAIFARALERVKNVPGVQYAAVAATVPFGRAFGANFSISGPDSIIHSSSMMNTITPDYFAALGARLVGGRVFTDRDNESAPRVVLINEMLANRLWGRTSPIGKCMRFGADTSPCAEIVGVVQNVRRQSLFEDSTGSVYFPLAQVRTLAYRQMIVRPSGDRPTRVIEAVRTAIQTAAPQLPYANVYLASDDPVVRRELRPTRLGASMFGAFGLLALVLAAVGIYAVVSYDVGQRTREMGVRLALGARAADVGQLVVRDGVTVIALGAAIGVVVVMLGAKFVAPLLYQISPRDPVVIVGVSATLIVVAIAACVVPAWRAMRVDAVVALRAE